jgi:hypothetical protein
VAGECRRTSARGRGGRRAASERGRGGLTRAGPEPIWTVSLGRAVQSPSHPQRPTGARDLQCRGTCSVEGPAVSRDLQCRAS